MRSPTQSWEAYRKLVYGTAELPESQEQECSRCFYAGMMEAATVFVRDIASIEDDDIAENALESYMNSIALAGKRTLK